MSQTAEDGFESANWLRIDLGSIETMYQILVITRDKYRVEDYYGMELWIGDEPTDDPSENPTNMLVPDNALH